MSPGEQRAFYETDGYLLFPEMLGREEVAVLRAARDEVLEEARGLTESTAKFSITRGARRHPPRAPDLQPDAAPQGVPRRRVLPADPGRRREPHRPEHPAPPQQAQPEAAVEPRSAIRVAPGLPVLPAYELRPACPARAHRRVDRVERAPPDHAGDPSARPPPPPVRQGRRLLLAA